MPCSQRSPSPTALPTSCSAARYPPIRCRRPPPRLDRIAAELGKPRRPVRPKRESRCAGAYLVGEVGRGKTMLMDLFFAAAPIDGEAAGAFPRIHGRDARRDRRVPQDAAASGDADPIAAVTKPILDETAAALPRRIPGQDITNAMLLGRLFEKAVRRRRDAGRDLEHRARRALTDGLNRQLFLPFIALLKQQVEIVPLDGRPTTGG